MQQISFTKFEDFTSTRQTRNSRLNRGSKSPEVVTTTVPQPVHNTPSVMHMVDTVTPPPIMITAAPTVVPVVAPIAAATAPTVAPIVVSTTTANTVAPITTSTTAPTVAPIVPTVKTFTPSTRPNFCSTSPTSNWTSGDFSTDSSCYCPADQLQVSHDSLVNTLYKCQLK